jgi:hypothetical protein
MVEKEIELEVFSANFKRHLVADECKADAKFDQESAQLCEEVAFEIALLRFVRERQKIEIVGVLENLICCARSDCGVGSAV